MSWPDEFVTQYSRIKKAVYLEKLVSVIVILCVWGCYQGFQKMIDWHFRTNHGTERTLKHCTHLTPFQVSHCHILPRCTMMWTRCDLAKLQEVVIHINIKAASTTDSGSTCNWIKYPHWNQHGQTSESWTGPYKLVGNGECPQTLPNLLYLQGTSLTLPV